MTSHRSRFFAVGLVLVAAVSVAGCGKPAGRHAHTQPAAARSATSTSTRPASTAPTYAAPAGERAALGAVARAFTAAICPYSYTDLVPYGQRLDAALERWATPGFAASRRWSSARTSLAGAGLRERQAEQVCGQVTGGLDPETDPGGGVIAVRLSVTVPAHALAGPTSSAQQVFDYQLIRLASGWRISSGHW